jgi:hypothetical protein
MDGGGLRQSACSPTDLLARLRGDDSSSCEGHSGAGVLVRSAVDRWKKVQNSRAHSPLPETGRTHAATASLRASESEWPVYPEVLKQCWCLPFAGLCTGGMREHLIHLDRELEIKIPDRRCAMAIDRLLSGGSPARMRSDAVSLSGRTAHARS